MPGVLYTLRRLGRLQPESVVRSQLSEFGVRELEGEEQKLRLLFTVGGCLLFVSLRLSQHISIFVLIIRPTGVIESWDCACHVDT